MATVCRLLQSVSRGSTSWHSTAGDMGKVLTVSESSGVTTPNINVATTPAMSRIGQQPRDRVGKKRTKKTRLQASILLGFSKDVSLKVAKHKMTNGDVKNARLNSSIYENVKFENSTSNKSFVRSSSFQNGEEVEV